MPKLCYKNRIRFGPAANNLLVDAIAIMREYADAGYDMTLRQLYYQLVSRDVIPNDQKEYDKLGDIINRGRLGGYVDWDCIIDRTRNVKETSTWPGPEDVVESAARSFHRDLWQTQENRVEVWIEKDALLGVIEPVCRRLRLPYFSCRGYVSQSEMWRASQRFVKYLTSKVNPQAPIILHMGDHDPSGIDMTRDIRDRLSMFLGGHVERTDGLPVVMAVRRIALNMDQIEEFEPPPNPAKMSDSRAREYLIEHGDSSWELDALDPPTMERLIQEEIDGLLDQEEWDRMEADEEDQRQEIYDAAKDWDSVVKFLSKKKEQAKKKKSRPRKKLPKKKSPPKKKKKKGKKKGKK